VSVANSIERNQIHIITVSHSHFIQLTDTRWCRHKIVNMSEAEKHIHQLCCSLQSKSSYAFHTTTKQLTKNHAHCKLQQMHLHTATSYTILLYFYYLALMPRAYVRLSVCNIGWLWSYSAIKSGNRHVTRHVGVLATYIQKLTQIVVSCYHECYGGRLVEYRKMLLHVSDNSLISTGASYVPDQYRTLTGYRTVPSVGA